jgi:hypothetical protein
MTTITPEELPIIVEALRAYAWNQIEPVCAGVLTSADEPAYSNAVASEKAARELVNTITERTSQ